MSFEQKAIVLVNLYPKKGEEVGKVRPCIILSDTVDNAQLDTVIVVPLSSRLIEDVFPYRVRLAPRGKLKQSSDVLVNHIRTVSKKRIVESPLGFVTDGEYALIKSALCQIL